jgi:hypothetical protein
LGSFLFICRKKGLVIIFKGGDFHMKLKKLGLAMGILFAISMIFGDLVAFGAVSGDAAAYFPLNTGTNWLYKRTVKDNVAFFKIKVTDPENGNPKIIVYDPNGTPRDYVYYIQNQQGLFKAKEIGSGGVFEYHPLWQVLNANMKVGTAWNWNSSTDKMKESAKVIGVDKVTVPAGTFDTIVVECTGNDQSGVAYTDKTWYTKGVGYVKDELIVADITVLSELCEYHIAN